MRVRAVRPVLLVAFAMLVLCAGLVAPRAVTSDDSADGSGIPTITTMLHPGWNMVGWVGSPTHVADLYDSIPTLKQAWRWDAELQEYQLLPQTSSRSLEPLLAGNGLWLNVSGNAPVEWKRSVADDGALLELRAGRNLVGWTGRDGMPIEDAVARFGDDAIEQLWSWNAEAQQYRLYHPGAITNSLTELNRGDAILATLSRDGRWWQPGTGRPEFVFKGDIPTAFQERFTWEMERIITFFAERYGVEPPEFSILLDPDSPWSAASSADTIWLNVVSASSRYTLVRWYFSMLRSHFDQVRTPFEDRIGSPFWLSVGVPEYAAGVYRQHIERRTYDDIRATRLAGVSQVIPETVDLREWAPAWARDVGALAVEWLVGRVAASSSGTNFAPLEPGGLDLQEESDAFIEYFRPQRTAVTWEDAFETVFGMTVTDFYDAFRKYFAALREQP